MCSSYFIMFGGFKGVTIRLTEAPGWQGVVERTKLWLEFFYFTTTTFCTVGFGDIHPLNVSARFLVTVVHFLTFGYVLFLLQTVLSREEPT